MLGNSTHTHKAKEYCLTLIIASGRDQTCRFAIKKVCNYQEIFKINNNLFKILVKFSCQSSSDLFYFIKTYLINQNIIKFNFNLTSPYYIFKLFQFKPLAIKKQLFNGQSIIYLAKFICNCSYQICNYHP